MKRWMEDVVVWHVEKRWDSIWNMVFNAMKGGNQPVVAYLIQQGQDAHASYQRGCDVAEFPTGSRIADCLGWPGATSGGS